MRYAYLHENDVKFFASMIFCENMLQINIEDVTNIFSIIIWNRTIYFLYFLTFSLFMYEFSRMFNELQFKHKICFVTLQRLRFSIGWQLRKRRHLVLAPYIRDHAERHLAFCTLDDAVLSYFISRQSTLTSYAMKRNDYVTAKKGLKFGLQGHYRLEQAVFRAS